MRSLLFLLTLVAFPSISQSAQDDRAVTLFSWFEQGQWFDLPVQFMNDGSAVPMIHGGRLVEDPSRNLSGLRYFHELEFQAEVLARCGESAVTTSLEKLRSKDRYVSIVAALALDRLLSLEAGNAYALGLTGLDEVEKTYRSRARLCFPGLEIPLE